MSARYLFGAPMGARPVSWKFTKPPGYGAPAAITERFSDDRWVFVGWDEDEDAGRRRRRSAARSRRSAQNGQLALQLDTKRDAGVPLHLPARRGRRGRLTPAHRQPRQHSPSIRRRGTSASVAPSYFLEQKAGLKTEIVAVGLDGGPVSGVPVDVTLTQIQWTSVRRAEGDGFYTWDTERKLVPAGKWTMTTAADPVPLDIQFASGGYLRARGDAVVTPMGVSR